MAEQQTYDHIDTLILKYLGEEANASEIAELENWVQADPQNKARFMEMKKVWMLIGRSEVDVDAAWERLAQQTMDPIPGRIVAMRVNAENVADCRCSAVPCGNGYSIVSAICPRQSGVYRTTCC